MRLNGVAGVRHSVLRGAMIAGLLAIAALGAGCSATPRSDGPTVLNSVALAPKTVDAPPASITAAPGEVRVTPGPFTDRIRLTGIRLDGPTVRGTLAITTDVSDVLALEVQAAFYDIAGKLVGTGTFRHADEDAMGGGGAHVPHNDGIDFAITSAPADAAVSAAVLTIPVLVNE